MSRSRYARFIIVLLLAMVSAMMLPDVSLVSRLDRAPEVLSPASHSYAVLPVNVSFDKQPHRLKRAEEIRPRPVPISLEPGSGIRLNRPSSNTVLGRLPVNDYFYHGAPWACRILDLPPPAVPFLIA